MTGDRVTWVTVGPPPFLATCQRCGAHEFAPPAPLPLTAFVLYLRFVQEKHRYCQPTDKAAP